MKRANAELAKIVREEKEQLRKAQKSSGVVCHPMTLYIFFPLVNNTFRYKTVLRSISRELRGFI